MNTRQELQHNELADWLVSQSAAVKPYLKTIIGVTILAVVGILAFSVMKGQNEGRSQAAWTDFFQAQSMGDADSAKEVARRFPKTEAAAWAWQWAGDYELTQASSDAFVDRAESREGLMEAKDAYEAALQSNPPSLIQRRSRFGLAQVHEALNELDEAAKHYQEIADRWPDSHVGARALDRIAFLQLPETREFSNWFAKQKPRERVSQVPTSPSGIPSPSQFDDLTDDPDLSLPDPNALESARGNAPFDNMTPPVAQPVEDGPAESASVEPDAVDGESGETGVQPTEEPNDSGEETPMADEEAQQDAQQEVEPPVAEDDEENPLRETSGEAESEPDGAEGDG